MVSTNLDETIGQDCIEYGNHRVFIAIRVHEGNRRNHLNAHPKRGREYGFYRSVYAVAVDDDFSGEPQSIRKCRTMDDGVVATNQTHALLDADPYVEPRRLRSLLPFVSARSEEARTDYSHATVPTFTEQLDTTCRPIFESLDEFYQFTAADVTIDMEVGIEHVQQSTSWIEIEDELDRITRELDANVA